MTGSAVTALLTNTNDLHVTAYKDCNCYQSEICIWYVLCAQAASA